MESLPPAIPPSPLHPPPPRPPSPSVNLFFVAKKNVTSIVVEALVVNEQHGCLMLRFFRQSWLKRSFRFMQMNATVADYNEKATETDLISGLEPLPLQKIPDGVCVKRQ